MIKIIKPSFVFSLLTLVNLAIAQNNTHSPYSARGFGEPEPFSSAYNRAFGGVSNGIRSSRFISFSNPASLSALKEVAFDFGFSAASGTLTNDKTSSTYYNGNFNYIVLGFPVWQKEMLKDTSKSKNNKSGSKNNTIKTYRTIWSSAIGLTPYSSLGTYSYKTLDTTYGRQAHSYANSGGLTNFFIMNAVNLTKNISLGLNVGYVFGQIRTIDTLTMSDSGVSRRLVNQSLYHLKGFKFDFGIQSQHYDTFSKRVIKKIVNKKDNSFRKDTIYRKIPLRMVFGASFNNSSPLNYNYTRQALNLSNYYVVSPMDTVIQTADKGKTYLPTTFSAGFSIRYNNKWMLAFDYSSSLLSKLKNPLFKDQYTNSSQFALGLGYKPDLDIESMNLKKSRKFKSNIEYRIGGRYNNTGYNFRDNTGAILPLKEYGLSFGLGFPILKTHLYPRTVIKSMMNLTIEYIHRGTIKNGMVDEQLFKLTVGVRLGDIWFTKKKFY